MENYGVRKWEQPCVCGHLYAVHNFEPYEHIKGIHGEDSYCFRCVNSVHKFKVDNLALIEQIARARKLV